MRTPLAATALTTLAVVAAACSGDGGGTGTPQNPGLEEGLYDFTITAIDVDTCWEEENLVPPTGVGIDMNVAGAGAAFTASVENAARYYLPPLTLARTANDLDVDGTQTLDITPECALAWTASGGGLVTALSTFTLDLSVSINATGVTASNGLASDCRDLSGGDIPDTALPFPALSNPTDGSCSLSIAGTARLPDDEE